MKNKRLLVVFLGTLVVLVILGIGWLLPYVVTRSGVTRVIDARFGDQSLKTTVALLELHHTRYGQYPHTLGDLKFVGDWDRNALLRVTYSPSSDYQTYYVEVNTG